MMILLILLLSLLSLLSLSKVVFWIGPLNSTMSKKEDGYSIWRLSSKNDDLTERKCLRIFKKELSVNVVKRLNVQMTAKILDVIFWKITTQSVAVDAIWDAELIEPNTTKVTRATCR